MSSLSKRCYLLSLLLLIGFSISWAIPRQSERKRSCLSRYLPSSIASWQGKKVQVTGRELLLLSQDTEFERMSYQDRTQPTVPSMEVSIVFSGKDLNNSIHRPERCLLAQGWNIKEQKTVLLKGLTAFGKPIPLRQIICSKPILLQNGKTITITRLQYYTFFGHSAITEGNYNRTFIDMKDRLLKGYDQQWAYATFSMPVTQSFVQGGFDPSIALSEKDSQTLLLGFIKNLLPNILKTPSSY